VKPFTVVDCAQRSEAWFAARLGRVTSSVASDMLATRRDGKQAAGRINLRVRLALERLTGRVQESGYVSKAMQDGIDREADALAEFEALTGTFVSKCGFLAHPTLMAGASLDGYLGDFETVVEVKAPIAATHLAYLKGVLPTDHYAQCVHQAWLTGARAVELVSVQPEFPDPLRVKVFHLEPKADEIAAHELMVRAFLTEVDREVEAIEALLRKAKAA
jgi:hypothetical protein